LANDPPAGAPRVAIVGAGPAGAALAYLLARRGLEVTLLERHTDFAREFRGEGLMPSGVDALHQMGLGSQLEALPHSTPRRVEIYENGRHAFSIVFGDDIAAGPTFVSQPALLEMLVAEAGQYPGFHLERGFTVRDVVQRHGRVAGVRGDAPSGSREISADLLIGTDGRASVLRKRSSLDREHDPEFFDVVWCKAPLPEFIADAHAARFYLAQGHFCLMFEAPDGRLQIGWVIEKRTFGELRRRGIGEWLGELASTVSPDLAAHLRAHRDDITDPFLLDVVCHHLEVWSEPGLLLLGDAAHPMSPVGAQGINLALRDAVVAANHLGPVLERAAPPVDLDAAARRVCDERLPEIREIQRLQKVPPRVLFQRSAGSRFVVRRVLPLLVRTPLPRLLAGVLARRFTEGTTEVRLSDA
jgi:2-polyprenyl-6-methoxyphenol hydroxylase-like FAD-dependent oxidoreductase